MLLYGWSLLSINAFRNGQNIVIALGRATLGCNIFSIKEIEVLLVNMVAKDSDRVQSFCKDDIDNLFQVAFVFMIFATTS